MQLPETPFTAIILAAQRAGHVDPLAEAAGISHKALVPIAGAPLIVHVAEALLVTPGLNRLRVVVEPEMFAPIATALDHPWQLDFVAAADNLTDSVIAAAEGVEGPMIVTTADNVLLTPGAVVQMLDVLEAGADAAIAMATKASVMAAHPSGQRRFYKFTDDEYSNCNLYAFANQKALRAAESFRSGGQFAKKPRRLIAAIGVINVLLFALHWLSLRGALKRMSRRFQLRIEPAVLEDGAHAIDVDNERTYRVAAILLEQRVRLQAPAEEGMRAAG